uniref:Myosin light chain 12B n=1 Tax=Nothoprocta perdicaria TaxID=30464 RepID=A0A8C6ZQ03_NOTPE
MDKTNKISKNKKGKDHQEEPQCATSSGFAMFRKSKDFNMIDQNEDSFIGKKDLHNMLASLGNVLSVAGHINFTMFLIMFGEILNGIDPGDVIRNVFACTDEESTGFIQEDYLRELLTAMGGRFADEEVDELYREAPIDKKGNFNYIEFTRILKHGAKDKDYFGCLQIAPSFLFSLFLNFLYICIYRDIESWNCYD